MRTTRSLLLASLATAGIAVSGVLSAPPARAQSTTLYRLTTTCSIRGGSPQPCVVEASEEGDVTTYRHTIGAVTETIRISEAPPRMGRLDATSNSWSYLSSTAARFSTNTVCFNGQDLCVVNPNYLNSIREDLPRATEGRDLLMVQFDPNGRVQLTCFDDGCQGVR